MAYTPYTPSASRLSTIQVPDDSELETSGIGANDTPLEELADGIAFLNGKAPLETGFVQITNIDTTPSTWVGVTGSGWQLVTNGVTPMFRTTGALAIGDIVEVKSTFMAMMAAGPTANGAAKVVIDDGVLEVDVAGVAVPYLYPLDWRSYTIIGRHAILAAAAGGATIALKGSVGSASDTLTFLDTTIHLSYTIWRP